MNVLSYRTLLLGVALCLTGSGQTNFSLQPKTPAEEANAWKLPKVKLFEGSGAGQISGGPRNDVPNHSTRLRPNAACGYILVIKPAPNFDSKMVLPPPKRTSSMLIIEGLPACSEMK